MTAAHPIAGIRPKFEGPVPSLAELIAGVAPALIAEHTPDRHDDCRVCSMHQGGRVKWPCRLVGIATLAPPNAGPAST
jgi:hypothetical protein